MRIKINDSLRFPAQTRPAPRAVSKRGFMPAAQYQRAHPGPQTAAYRIAQGLLRAFQIGRRRNQLPKSTSRSCPWWLAIFASALRNASGPPAAPGTTCIAFYPSSQAQSH
ncbi:Uncharacterised protein [Salmonella enterica subsp. enterica]|uniref:Uncharacterized protein n=1 Tax=Salmonella enterica I TaxID=59201 RepID=A0A379WXE5_SALET|nr:Uncharacterised protein [Salmonella enterica subsp. enterica]